MKRTPWPTCLLRGEEGRAATFHRAARRERSMRVWLAIQAVLAYRDAFQYGHERGWVEGQYDARKRDFG